MLDLCPLVSTCRFDSTDWSNKYNIRYGELRKEKSIGLIHDTAINLTFFRKMVND